MSYSFQIRSLDHYNKDYKKTINVLKGFWAEVASSFFWGKKWFINAKLNITENCIDRHLKSLGDKPAIIWEPNNPEERTRIVTYNRLHKRVCQVVQMLKNNGV